MFATGTSKCTAISRRSGVAVAVAAAAARPTWLTVRKLTYTLPLPLSHLLPSFVLLPRLFIFDLPVFPSLSIFLPLGSLYLDDPVFPVATYIASVSGSIGSVLDRDIGLLCSTVPTLSLRPLAAARHCTLTSHHIESIRTTSRPSFVQNRSSRDV
ncbi:hypothetical protein CH63R_06973 [Colletotrichum higginsianum IMI 349063]|uniref:Uncharacterized protein n=1 Tax=Colletotrichum higginsianum (strain IMI 349063) TaxID=759273 RepID=A0A1B7Y8D3_COLHI|nr:hypothetical protein CH63R_06973 [Colletotrichum higginsianum IMI 349063]OBR08208.1 hypothetical protein CH63R_06973 [Colletotrichum higginsianum IMI 349063]